MKISILNGPNLNLLGGREPEIYGATTLPEIEKAAIDHGLKAGCSVTCRQTNHEGHLVDWVQEAGKDVNALIINPGALTHTSIALHDALKTLTIPKVELHLSNIHSREDFRRVSFVSPAVDAIICGLGADGYIMALDAALRLIEKQE